MATLEMQGLVVVNVVNSRARALMINSATAPSALRDHKQGLYVHEDDLVDSATAVDRTELSGPALVKRLGPVRAAGMRGWDLDGLRVRIKGKSRLRLARAAARGEFPPGTRPDWSSLQWVTDTARLLPGARLKKSFSDLGANIRSVIDLEGGTLHGGTPDERGGRWVWFLRPGFVQAITDRIAWTSGGGTLSLALEDQAGRPVGTIAVRPEARVRLLNEAERPRQPKPAQARARGRRARPEMPDVSGYFVAFDDPKGSALEVDPIALYPFQEDVMEYDTGHCMGIINFEGAASLRRPQRSSRARS
jgi:hypothetical protein